MSIEPDASGAAKRVQDYIVDAHEWESNLFTKKTPELERELEGGRNAWITTGLRPFSESIRQQLRANGVETLRRRAASKESLQLLGEKHWVGDAYLSELDVLASPSKHEPQFELVIEARMVEAGRAVVITAMSGGFLEGTRRTYSVEKEDRGWRIRKYDEASTDDR